jgi:IS5 family transposase
MLRLSGGQVESLVDEVLPSGVGQLPGDLAVLDGLLGDRALLEPVQRAWAESARDHGRPSVPIDRFVRLMIVKHRSGWGYETLVCEVSDSLHLRRFCLLALSDQVPDESTIRKLARRLGPQVVKEICRHVIAVAAGAPREQRFTVRAVRIDSTVIEGDVRYPTDIGLADDTARTLARESKKVAVLAGEKAPKVRDRSRGIRARCASSIGRWPPAPGRPRRPRSS